MKIWHLISNRWNSAISEYAISAARATVTMGADVLTTSMAGSPVEKRILELGLRSGTVEHFGPGKIPYLAAAARKIDPDIIMTYGGPETTAAHFFKGRARLVRFYGYQSGDVIPLGAVAKKIGHLRVDHIITPAEIISRSLSDVVTCPVSTVVLGCDEQLFKPVNVASEQRPSLLIFGRLDPVKGHREFLEVFAEILRRSIDHSGLQKNLRPKLKIVGLPANLSAAHIHAVARELKISTDDYEILCERVADVAHLMSSATLGVVSSLGSEAICRVAQEFLLCGTPVVTTAVGSLPEIFKEENFGLVYASDDKIASARKIYEILMTSYQDQMSVRHARSEMARAHFSLPAMSQRLSEILHS